MDPKQQEAFRKAVERKSEEAEEASRHPEQNPRQGDPAALDASGQAQPGSQTDDRGNPDVVDPRTKSSKHGQTTADKWNQ